MEAHDTFEVSRRQREVEVGRTRRLTELDRRWSKTIRNGLRDLAQALWPDRHLLGVVPIHHYRLRHQVELGTSLWWIEHDIPPDDEHRCAAYQVLLTLDTQNKPLVAVRSGKTEYSVAPLRESALEATLAQAGQDPALVILRQMGEAIDP